MNAPTSAGAVSGAKPPYSIIDTYDADLINEYPPRREAISEIQNRDEADLLCYANPVHAELICRAVNSFEEMRAALRAIVDSFHNGAGVSFVQPPVMQQARAALARAEGSK